MQTDLTRANLQQGKDPVVIVCASLDWTHTSPARVLRLRGCSSAARQQSHGVAWVTASKANNLLKCVARRLAMRAGGEKTGPPTEGRGPTEVQKELLSASNGGSNIELAVYVPGVTGFMNCFGPLVNPIAQTHRKSVLAEEQRTHVNK